MATAGWWAPGPVVGSGVDTAQLAAQRGLCKPEQCDLFAQLNPYQHYGNGWDELIRQGYALGDIQAWSASSGTVAHEIAHIRNAKKLGEMKRSRELELEADREAATMLARADYPARICQRERLAAMRAHVDAMGQQSPASEPSTRISTSYSRADNLLTLTPQPR